MAFMTSGAQPRVTTQNTRPSAHTAAKVGGISVSVGLIALGALALLGLAFPHTPVIGGLGAFLGKTGAFVALGAGTTPLLTALALNRIGENTPRSQLSANSQLPELFDDLAEAAGLPTIGRDDDSSFEDDFGNRAAR